MRSVLAIFILTLSSWSLLSAAPAADFKLADVNPNSPRRNARVSPRDYLLQVSAYYFGAAHWGYCSAQFGYLNQIQGELRTNKTALNMEVLGINQIGDESYNATFTQTRTLAWLQDTPEQSVWKNWGVTYRDVRILDAQNKVRFVYNLSAHDLSLAENRAALTQMLLSAAEAADSDQDGLLDDWEILNFGSVAHTGVEDPDVDGATNLAEFAFGTNPNDPGSLVPLRMVTVQAATASFSFRRRLGSLLDYVLETSSDLKEWGPAAPEWVSLQAPRNLFDGTGTAEVVGTLTRTASEPLRFLRVRATGKP